MDTPEPGGQGDRPPAPDDYTRSDLADVRRAVRQDWPIPAAVQSRILQRLIDYCDRDHADGENASPRTVIAAARTIATFAKVALGQRIIDVKTDELERRDRPADGIDLAEAVERAERLAEERLRQLADGTAD